MVQPKLKQSQQDKLLMLIYNEVFHSPSTKGLQEMRKMELRKEHGQMFPTHLPSANWSF